MRIPTRIPILYLIISVLVLVAIVPMSFYASYVISNNRDALKTKEREIQTAITRSLSDDLAEQQKNLRMTLVNFSSVVEISSGGSLAGERVNSPQMRALIQRFVTESNEIAYATMVNPDLKGISAGRIDPDDWMKLQINNAFHAAQQNHGYTGQAIRTGSGRSAKTVVLFSVPIQVNGHFVGMIAAFVDLESLVRRLQAASEHNLATYIVDDEGRLVAASDPQYATGQDMTKFDIVKNFVVQGGRAALTDTHEFVAEINDERVSMLGTCRVVPSLGWAVIAQKRQADAYAEMYVSLRMAQLVAALAILASILISSLAARRLTTPLEILTESSRAIARGDFSQRVKLRNRTEIGELAETFNVMSSELEKLVADLKRAAEENRALFLGSIQMLAGAVDEKDPYTRGHSDRVTRYSMAIATELGMGAEEIERIRISAQLHDVGKIGIEDRILKKPGALTPEEFDVMKTHTSRGGNILRPVRQLKEMIPGIELHHESLDGRGYPYGLKGEEIPIAARIIMIADAFDAMTTDRPYQKAMDGDHVIKIIKSLASSKFDPECVAAFERVYERGELGKVGPKREAAAATV